LCGPPILGPVYGIGLEVIADGLLKLGCSGAGGSGGGGRWSWADVVGPAWLGMTEAARWASRALCLGSCRYFSVLFYFPRASNSRVQTFFSSWSILFCSYYIKKLFALKLMEISTVWSTFDHCLFNRRQYRSVNDCRELLFVFSPLSIFWRNYQVFAARVAIANFCKEFRMI
jgi:hypothetical protein